MFADSIWNLYNLIYLFSPADERQTTSPKTNQFFLQLLERSPFLPDSSLYSSSLFLTTTESNILITAHPQSTHVNLLARALHPPSLLTPSLNVKCEPSSPLPLQQFIAHQTDPFQAPSSPPFAGQLVSVLSPKRVIAREASCSQFDAKLESPSRINAKSRQERRVQSLLPDLARRRKAELDNPFSNDRLRQNNSRESSVGVSLSEVQTKEAVKQTVVAALRLHSISPSDGDYKALINQCVGATMFALRGKLQCGKCVGMGEIGGIVEGLLKIFLN
jgi:Sld7 C-terminal domain